MSNKKEPKERQTLRVAFLHLDLGIGGAEQLVVNAAVALQQKGHQVTIFTTHHDPSHCFAETTGQGPLAATVRVYGDWLPRHVLGRFTALCAVVRMVYLAVVVGLLSLFGPQASSSSWDLTFCDGVSAMVPLLRLFGLPVLFYCHYPDKLLCVDRQSFLKRLYRAPLDWLEEVTTGASTAIAVNSKFTAGVFKEAFRRVGHRFNPVILYPAINLQSFVPPKDQQSTVAGPITSLNRFERKKNIGLAIEAFGIVKQRIEEEAGAGGKNSNKKNGSSWTPKLVVAGGYDEAVRENVEHLQELKKRAEELGLTDDVSFRTSISDQERAMLLQDSLCVVYTPDKEHFGIVPIEAMYAGTPVIAVSSGGPLETVKDGETGFLCPGERDSFAQAMLKLVQQPSLKASMGKHGHQHVKAKFSLQAFAEALDAIVQDMATTHPYSKAQAIIGTTMLTGAAAGISAAWLAVTVGTRIASA